VVTVFKSKDGTAAAVAPSARTFFRVPCAPGLFGAGTIVTQVSQQHGRLNHGAQKEPAGVLSAAFHVS
jgi:hypothetical protein